MGRRNHRRGPRAQLADYRAGTMQDANREEQLLHEIDDLQTDLGRVTDLLRRPNCTPEHSHTSRAVPGPSGPRKRI